MFRSQIFESLKFEYYYEENCKIVNHINYVKGIFNQQQIRNLLKRKLLLEKFLEFLNKEITEQSAVLLYCTY